MVGSRSEAVYDNDPRRRRQWEWQRAADSITSVVREPDASGSPSLSLISVEDGKVIGSIVIHDNKTKVPSDRSSVVGGRTIEVYEDASCTDVKNGTLVVRAGRVIWRVRASDLAVLASPTVLE